MDTKKTIIAMIGILALGFVSGWFGRGATPSQVTEHTIETRLQTQVVNNTYKVDTAELQKLIADQFARLQKNVKVESTIVKRKDGTTTTHIVSTDNSTETSSSHVASSIDSHTSASGTGSTSSSQLQVTDTFKSVVTGKAPAWAFGIQATYQPFYSAGFNLVPNNRLVAGVTIEHRLFGPVWVGIVANSTLAGGLELKLVH